MKLRSCGNTHFIQAIRGGLVIKVRNRDSHEKPALITKTLKDVYEAEDAKRLGRSFPNDFHNTQAGFMLNHEQVTCEIPCVPVVDRILCQTHECVSEADDGLDSDLDDETTLTQLRKRFLIRKRKFIHISSGENFNQASENETAVEDESDLNEPLIKWKSKNSKGSKSKRKCMSGAAVSHSTIASAVKFEENILSEGSLRVGGELAPVLRVKVEVQEAGELSQSKIFSADLSYHAHNEVPSPVGEASNKSQNMAEHECQEPVFFAQDSQDCVTNEISYEHLENVNPGQIYVTDEIYYEHLEDVDPGQSSVIDEMSYKHLEDVEPLCMLVPWNEMNVKLETVELGCQEFLDSPPLAIEGGSEIQEAYSCRSSPMFGNYSELCSHSRASSINEEISEQSSSPGVQIPNMAVEDTVHHHELSCVPFDNESRADSPQEQDYSPSSPGKKYNSFQDSITSLKIDSNLISMEATILEVEQPPTCSSDDVTNDGLNHASCLEDELLKTGGNQTSASSITDVERQSCSECLTFDCAETHSTPESRQPPERLLSTRKAISPSSQEKLCWAMNSVELCDDADQRKSGRKLFEKQTGNKASSVKSDIQPARMAANHSGSGKVVQRKVVISPRPIMNKTQNVKGNLEGPRFSRTLPNLNTGCTSIEGCSESAIAFSKRQLHDMEILAEKLMNELKSMKDIVEQKLLFEAYRNVSLRNDADEVKSAINSAAKVEEVAQKWLNMMSRDCHRFCKIMKLTPNNAAAAAASDNAVPRQKRKIMFADEVGGKLCHVKLFDVGVKQEENSI